MRNAIRVAIVALVVGLGSAQPAGAAPYNAHFAGWDTASGLYPDEISAEFQVPTIPNGGLIDWVGLGGSNGDVFQAGAGTLPNGSIGCWWEDYPYNNQVQIPGLRCAPGDFIFADVSQGYYGHTQSRVIVEDLTTGQSSGWLSVYTPDLASNPNAEVMVEGNTSLGAFPTTFSPLGWAYSTATFGGFVGSGGTSWTFAQLNANYWIGATDSLAEVIPGVSLIENWPGNGLGVVP